MADPILHIKDGYFFEVPRAMWPARYEKLSDVPQFLTTGPHADIRAVKLLAAEHKNPAVRETPEYKQLMAEVNESLTGKILIPQPPGARLKNLYEPEKGSFGITRFMVLEFVVAILMFVVLTQYARRMSQGQLVKGRFWNMVDVFVDFIRKGIVHAAMGEHDGDKFVPFIGTMFFFILGCNLFGMLPWCGSPTGEFGVTIALAVSVLLCGMIAGMLKLGFFGYWGNQIPAMDLPIIFFPVKVMLWVIEVMGLFIKHGVLAIRLLANIVAGHLVLTSIMAIAATAGAYSVAQWLPAALIVVPGCALLGVLELFVAFLQAFVFCFLASLFIGAAVHHH